MCYHRFLDLITTPTIKSLSQRMTVDTHRGTDVKIQFINIDDFSTKSRSWPRSGSHLHVLRSLAARVQITCRHRNSPTRCIDKGSCDHHQMKPALETADQPGPYKSR
jgi:hypothetical protein